MKSILALLTLLVCSLGAAAQDEAVKDLKKASEKTLQKTPKTLL
jgi:hypothetical protein